MHKPLTFKLLDQIHKELIQDFGSDEKVEDLEVMEEGEWVYVLNKKTKQSTLMCPKETMKKLLNEGKNENH